MFRRIRSTENSRSRALLWLPILAVLLSFAACDDDDYVDATPPAAPSGLGSVTGDTRVYVYWTPNREADLAGYRVWTNNDGGSQYFLLDEFDAYDPAFYEPGDGPGTDLVVYEDFGLQNGKKYWYAISAYDSHGNESELSYEYLSDVPRPEGETVLFDVSVANGALSGFDFSKAVVDDSAQPFDAASTDVWLQFSDGGIPYLWTPDYDATKLVLVQDYGYVSFDTLSWAPVDGYSLSGIVEAIEGHTYAFAIILDPEGAQTVNYGKLTITQLDDDSAVVIWGYQGEVGERELVVPDARERRTQRELRMRALAEEVTR